MPAGPHIGSRAQTVGAGTHVRRVAESSNVSDAMEPSYKGVPADFEELYRIYAGRIYRYCLFRSGSRQDAEDITAEVFIRHLDSAQGRIASDRLLAWLYRVATNLCINQTNRIRTGEAVQGRHRRVHRAELSADQPSEGALGATPIKRAFGRLKKLEQQAVFLRAVEDMSFKDLAKAIGKKEGAAKMLFYRGVKKLRAAYEQEEVSGWTHWSS